MFFLALMPLKNSLFLLFHIKHNLYLFLISDTNIMYFSGTSKFLRNFFQNIFNYPIRKCVTAAIDTIVLRFFNIYNIFMSSTLKTSTLFPGI